MTPDRAPDRRFERSGSSDPGFSWRPRPEASLPTTEVWGFEPAFTPLPLSIRIDHHPAPAPSVEVRREWAEMQAKNPHLYDAPILNIVWFDAEQASMLARADSYQRLAVQPRVQTSVRHAGVNALLCARDAAGREHILFGRRGPKTRMYRDQWELGPAGGLDSWHPGQITVDPAAIIDQVADEVREEASLDVEGGSIVGIVRDDIACSYDIFVRFDLGDLSSIRAAADGSEYAEIAWLPTDQLAAFDRDHAHDIITPARAVIRAMGWV